MRRERIQKPKPRRRPAAHGEPLDTGWTCASAGTRVAESIEELVEEIDRALRDAGHSA